MSIWDGTTGTIIFSYTYTGTINDQVIIPTFNSEYNDYELSMTVGDGTINVNVLATATGYDIGYDYDTIYYDALYLPSKISFQGLNTVTNIEFYSAMESGFNENGLAYTVGGLTDMSNMFNGCSSLTSIEGLQYVDTSKVTTMYNAFYGCSKLTTLDLSGWNTDNVTTIETMFAYCSSLLTVIGLNELNVSRVDNMGGLFTDCSNLTEININSWDVSKVTNFGAVFRRCPKLTHIDLSKWDTSSGIIMSGIFTNCSGLIEIDLSNWDMSHANSVSQMFYGCSALMKLKMYANLNQGAVTTYWFGKCNSLSDVQLFNFDTYTINKVIDELPTRSANNQGSLIIPKIDDSINTTTADSKYWIVSPDPTNVRQMNLGGTIISNLCIGEVGVKKVYLGETIVYENKQATNNVDILYNEFTSTLFILKEDALSYNEEELALNINNDIIRVDCDEENSNLNIGGDK